jgi:hypothetical protein
MKCDCCEEKAQWVRCTQFAGNHYFCDLHALQQEDFGQDDSYAFWTEHNYVPEESKLYVVDVVSTFRMRYVVEAKSEDHAWDEVVVRESDTEFKEFSQHHIGTHIFSSREVDTREYLELFDKDNSYLSKWTDEQKLDMINKIDY